ncbi:hypothetical protein H6F93_31970 [Leptolyngbya sp. FACHB-671]|nr:hypothetical protein [Cyanobacteria bacterium FACHB-471]MBD2072087.1 hypothetical protein [Leptolyngbya sp. FACHB-671]
MSKRFSITVPDEVYADLEKWADGEGRPTANLAGFLVEVAVKRKYKDKYPDVEQGK